MRIATRIGRVLSSVALLAVLGVSPLFAQTPATASSSITRTFGGSDLGADFSSSLRSSRRNVFGPLYYQEGRYGVTGHFLGNTFNVVSGKMSASAWQLLGVPVASAESEVTFPSGYVWTAFEPQLTITGQNASNRYPLVRIFNAQVPLGWWVFTIRLGIEANLTLDASMAGVRFGMGNNVLTGLAGSMRTGIGANVVLSAGVEINLLVVGGSVTVRAGATLIGAGLNMPFYLDPAQVSSQMNLQLYQAVWVDIVIEWWILFWGDTYVWNLVPYTSWNLGSGINLLAVRG